MSIRGGRKEDCNRVADIYNLFLGKSTMDTIKKDGKDYYQYIDEERECLLVLEIEGVIYGWCIIKKYSLKFGYRFVCETSTFFHPEAVGKGYGRKIKEEAIQHARKMGYSYIIARIFSSNKRSIGLNLSMGYRIVGEQERIGYVNDKWENVTIMEYHIL